MRLLVVEDNEQLAELLAQGLQTAGYETDVLTSLEEASAVLRTTFYAALILDLGLPDGDGLALLRELRHRNNPIPVLVLTARGGLHDRVQGLRSGADDYLVKPFAVPELIARLHALTRRGKATDERLAYADLGFDLATRTATRGNHAIELTGREAALLELLLRDPGRTVTRERAIDEIWGGAAEANVVDRYITRLRRKLGEPPLIRTLRGSGFVLRA